MFSSISADFSNFSWFFPELSVNIRQKKKKVYVSDIMAKKIWLGRSIQNFILFWNFIFLFNVVITLLSSRCRVSICWPFKSVSHQNQTCIPAKYHGRNHLSSIKRADSFLSSKKDREISQNKSAQASWSRERRHFGSAKCVSSQCVSSQQLLTKIYPQKFFFTKNWIKFRWVGGNFLGRSGYRKQTLFFFGLSLKIIIKLSYFSYLITIWI